MCFDKKLSKHNQWSKLSIMIHLHVKNKKFTDALSKPIHDRVPVIVRATIEKYMDEASYHRNCENSAHETDGSMQQLETHRQQLNAQKREIRKRKELCECAFTEYHEARLGEKRARRDGFESC